MLKPGMYTQLVTVTQLWVGGAQLMGGWLNIASKSAVCTAKLRKRGVTLVSLGGRKYI